MKKFPSRKSERLIARTLKRLQIRRATLFVTLFAVLLSTFTFVNQPPARADTAGTGACTQTFTKTGTGEVAVTEVGGYCYAAFKNTGAVGSQTSFSWTRPTGINTADVLVIGGGGGGGSRHGGGGGAGAFVETSNLIISSASSVAIVIGAGGAGAPGGSTYVGSRGQASSFKSGSNGLTAIGGGAGVNGSGDVNGGSGGGGGAYQTAGTVTSQAQTNFAGGTITGITFGSNGASGAREDDGARDYWAGGGGGGAGSAGLRPTINSVENTELGSTNHATARGGNGGAGKIPTFLNANIATSLSVGQVSSSSVYFAGGGGGGMGADGVAGGTGGLGGGANGTRSENVGNNGTAFTGGGGGGSGFDDIGPLPANTAANPEGGDGGSGVVVIRYALTGEILRFDATNPDSYTSGTTWNDLASAKNGSLLGGVTLNSRTKAFDLDGTNDYVDLPDLTNDLSNGFAIHAVIDFGAVNDWERIFEFSAGGTVSSIALGRNGASNQLILESFNAAGNAVTSCTSNTDAIQPGFHSYSLVVQADGVCQFYRNGTTSLTTGALLIAGALVLVRRRGAIKK